MKNVVVIYRGIPGSGKSMAAFNRAYANAQEGSTSCIVSADNYFMKSGRYVFDPTKLKQAHEECFNRFLDALIKRIGTVIVDNTNTQLWEFMTYLKVAIAANYDFEVIEFKPEDSSDMQRWAERCIHRVPYDKVKQMNSRFETFNEEEFRKSIFGSVSNELL